jgi:hypothetical protein
MPLGGLSEAGLAAFSVYERAPVAEPAQQCFGLVEVRFYVTAEPLWGEWQREPE